MNYQPGNQPLSTRVKISGLLVLILIALSFIPGKWLGFGKKGYIENSPLTSDVGTLTVQNLVQETNEDPDGDGIPNWQEALIGTNKNSPSTNGVLDRTKINTSSESLTTNGAPIATLSQEDKANLAAINDPTNVTAQIAKNSLGIASYFSQQDSVDEQTQKTTGENIYNEAAKLAEKKKYTTQDLTTLKKETSTDIKTYGNAVGTLLFNALKKTAGVDDLTPLQLYLEKGNTAALMVYTKKLEVIVALRDSLLSMTVPASAVSAHLEMLNAIETYRNDLYNFSKVQMDSMRALIAAQEYKEDVLRVLSIPNIMATYFDSKNIVFTTKDSGYLFTQAILDSN